MFKFVSSIFKTAPAPIIPVTRELLNKRSKLCTTLDHIYKAQVGLITTGLPEGIENNVPLLKYYTAYLDSYNNELNQLSNKELCTLDFSEENFISIINKQLDGKLSELETINNQITPADLRLLDKHYSSKIDLFFSTFHTNRISASFELKEYLYPKPLLQIHNAKSVVDQAITTTFKMLTLNDYPVPKFEIVDSDENLKIYCVAPHVVHIMFELFKNATLPSIAKGKPILISINVDESDPNTIVLKIKDNGGGMKDSMVKKIWQFHYTTTKDSDRDPIHGFGMGLPLCKVFAEFNDGSLTLKNTQGEGVAVYLKLPKGIEQ